MIGVRGSGCSMPITDATASASDIVSGKVAYGNNGRIVGTHTESKITDATASAADIVSGKVAYNNYGRIVGTHTESKITDATASAKDIVSGKVAYNNYGRVTGTLDTSNLFKSVNITIQQGEYAWTDRDDDVFIYYGKKGHVTYSKQEDAYGIQTRDWKYMAQRANWINHTSLANLGIKSIVGYSHWSVSNQKYVTTYTQYQLPTEYVYDIIDLSCTSNEYKRMDATHWYLDNTHTNPDVGLFISTTDAYVIVDSYNSDTVAYKVTMSAETITIYYV